MKRLRKIFVKVFLCFTLSFSVAVPSNGQVISDLIELLQLLGIDISGPQIVYDPTQTTQSIKDALSALNQAQTTFGKLKEMGSHLEDYTHWINDIYTQLGTTASAIVKVVKDVTEYKTMYLRYKTYIQAVASYHSCLNNWEASGGIGKMGMNLLNILNRERSFLNTGVLLINQTLSKLAKDFAIPGLDGSALIERVEKTDDEVKESFTQLYEHMRSTASQVETTWMVQNATKGVDLPVEKILGGKSAESYASDVKEEQKYSVGLFTVILLLFGVMLAGYGVIILMRQTSYDPLANTMYWVRLGVGMVIGALLISIL